MTNLQPIPGPRPLYTPPDWLWLLVNLSIPVVGVLVLQWNLFGLLYLFWMELILIGLFGLLRILLAYNGKKYWLAALIPKIGSAAFYTVLFGALILLVMAFSMKAADLDSLLDPPGAPMANTGLGWALIALFLSFTLEFLSDFVLEGQYKTAFHIPELIVSIVRVMPLGLIVLFALVPLAEKMEGHQANVVLILGIVLTKTLLDYLFKRGRAYFSLRAQEQGGGW